MYRTNGSTDQILSAINPHEDKSLIKQEQSTAFAAFGADADLTNVDVDFVKQCLEGNQLGDAQLIAHLNTGRLVYDDSERKWYSWNGCHWEEVSDSVLRIELSKQLAAQYLTCALHITTSKNDGETDTDYLRRLSESMSKRANVVRTVQRIESVLKFAEGMLQLPRSWDSEPMLLGVQNGVIDLRTGQLRPGHPDDYIRTVIPTEWKGLHEPDPQFEKFFAEIFQDDQEKANYVRRLLGYAIAGQPDEDIIAFLVGDGRNGKDTLIGIFEKVLGDNYVGLVQNEVLIHSGRTHSPGAPSPHLMALRGKRIAYVNETDENQRLSIAQVKQLTGGGTITARLLFKDLVHFPPTHVLFLMTNRRPRIAENSSAIWERVKVIEFKQCFLDNPRPGIPNEHPKDPGLQQKLVQESSGILAWLVRACLEYQEHGLKEPACIRASVQEYRDEENLLQQFVDERCWRGPNDDGLDANGKQLRVQSSDLYKAYQSWCREWGHAPVTQKKFGTEMVKDFERKDKPYRVYLGVELTNDHANVLTA